MGVIHIHKGPGGTVHTFQAPGHSGHGFQDKPAIAAQPMLLYSGYTSKGGEGHGVGLTIVREIIEDVEFHNGQLDVPSSEPGRTTFGFAIPLESTRAVHVRT